MISVKDLTVNLSASTIEELNTILKNHNLIEMNANALAGQQGEVVLSGTSRIGLAIPFGSMFAVEPTFAMAIGNFLTEVKLSELEEMRLRAEARRSSSRSENSVNDGNARIELIGAMTKRPHCLAELFGGTASTLETQRLLLEAEDDTKVKDIHLQIESPGGDVSGAFDLADTIYKVAKKKPIYAYLSDQATSAAYLAASQATRIFGNPNVLSGSIGVYTTLVDTSGRAAMQGAKVHLVKAGKFKGTGVPGVPISADDIKTVQARVDAFHGLFVKYVKRGRKMSDEEVGKISDAQVFVGAEAIKFGLIDEIVAEDEALEWGRSKKGRIYGKKKIFDMSVTQDNNIEGAEQILTAEEVVRLNTQIEDETIPVAPAAVSQLGERFALTAGSAAWISVAAALGLGDMANGAVAETAIRELMKLGQDYDATVRDNAIKMSVAAGLGDMTDFIKTLPFANALAHLRKADSMVKASGLADPNRQSVPTEPNDAVPIPPARPAGANGEEKPTENDNIRGARVEMQKKGLYAL